MRVAAVTNELVLDDDLVLAGEHSLVLGRLPGQSFDLILDPPFNTGRAQSRLTPSVRADEDGRRVGFGGRRMDH